MASVISAGTTSSTSLNLTADTSGVLQLASNNGTVAMTIDTSQNVSFTNQPTFTGGTANGVAYLNGSKVVTTGSALTFDGNQLGLTPTSGNAVTKLFGPTGSGVGAYFAVYAQGANSGYFGTDSGITGSGTSNDLTIYPAGSNNIRFYQGGAEQMRLTSTGLGIGTSSPSQKLDVQSPTSIIVSTSTTGTNSVRFVQNNTGGQLILGIDNSAGSSAFGVGAYAAGLWYTGAYPLVFATNNTERMRLDSSGNLGLGVTPSAWDNNFKAFQIGYPNFIAGNNGGNRLDIGVNAYFSTNYKYANTAAATYYSQASGAHIWYNAPSGTAGNAITFTQAMTLDASGNLGVGNTNPSAPVDIQANSGGTGIRIRGRASANAGALRFFANDNTTQRARFESNDTSFEINSIANLPITISTNNTERARIDTSGNWLYGGNITTAEAVNGLTLVRSGANTPYFVSNTSQANRIHYYFQYNGTTVGNISTTTTATSYGTSSDYRLKNSVAPMTGALAKVSALKPVTYKWNVDGSDGEGFIAHELQAVVPQCVAGEKDAVETYTDAEGNEQTRPVYQSVDTSFLVATLTAAIKEQQALIETLTTRITALEAK